MNAAARPAAEDAQPAALAAQPAASDAQPAAEAGASPYNRLAWFAGEPVIGADTRIGPFCLIDGSGGLVIGRGCDLAGGVHVYTHSSTSRCVSDRAVPVVTRQVRIGDCTFIGANAVILMGVTIGSHCVIGAGAVVGTDVPDFGVAVGVPARVVGTVDSQTGKISYAEPRGSHAHRAGLHAGPAQRTPRQRQSGQP